MNLPVHFSGTPFFSVVIATRNRAHLLPRALDSLLAQTESDWEAIVVDDGSLDGTALRLLRYINDTRPRFRYLYHTHRGTARSRNAGILASCGRYVTFLDSDDWYRPEHLALRRAYLETHPEARILHGGLEVLGNPYVPDVYRPGHFIHVEACATAGTLVVSRDLLLEVGGFPTVPYAEDAELMRRLEHTGHTIHRIEAPTYVYDRRHLESTTAQKANAREAVLPGRFHGR